MSFERAISVLKAARIICDEKRAKATLENRLMDSFVYASRIDGLNVAIQALEETKPLEDEQASRTPIKWPDGVTTEAASYDFIAENLGDQYDRYAFKAGIEWLKSFVEKENKK